MRFPQLVSIPLVLTLLVVPAAADAAPGALDGTFGTSGITTDPVFGAPSAIAVQPNGGVLTLQGTGVARHRADGAVDLSWGTDGAVQPQFPSGNVDLANIAVQRDSKIVVVGDSVVGSGADFAVARLNTDGSPDTSFSDDGFLTVNFGGASDDDYAYDVAVDVQGRIVVAGSVQPGGAGEKIGVVRLTTGGSFDDSFSGDGRQTVDVNADDEDARTVAIDSTGRVVLGGYGSENGEGVLVLARLTDSGELDNGWNGDGTSTFEFIAGEDDKLDDLTVQPDDKVLIAGGPVISATNPTDLTVARFDSGGTLDDGFGTAGIARRVTPGVSEHALAVGLQSDGKIVLGGYIVESGTAWDHLAARLDSEGALDPTFGTGGIVRTDVSPGARDQGTAMAVQPDGRIIIGGGYDTDPNDPFPILGESLMRLIGLETKLSLTASGTGTPRAGETATYRFTVYAGDVDAARDTRVSGSVPGVDVVAVAASQGSCTAGQSFSCDLGGIASGASATVTVTARSGAPGTHTAQASAANANYETSLTDNSASAAVAWGPAAAGPGPIVGENPPAPNREPDSAIAKLASKISARKLKAFTGTASDDHGSLARVEIALVRLDGKRACYWLTSSKGRFKKKKPNRRGECTGPVWLRASGTTKWTYKLKKRLPKGKYVVHARAVDTQGLVEKSISAGDGNRRTFTLR